MHPTDLVLFATFVALYGLVSKRLASTPVTAPILAVLYGIAMGPSMLDAIHLEVEGHGVRLLAEFTLAFVLFHDAASVDLRKLKGNRGSPERLLIIALPLTIALGGVLAVLVIGPDEIASDNLGTGIGVWGLLLLGAILAPTDAALGVPVVSSKAVPERVRQTLTVESGLNDGLVVPVVTVLVACTAGTDATGPADWAIVAARAIGVALASGALIGLVGAKLLDLAERHGWVSESAGRATVAAIPIAAFFLAESLGGSGFLAAFLGGLAFGSTTHHLRRDSFDLAEDAGDVLGQITWIAFGVAAVPYASRCARPEVIVFALLALTVVRMAPVALALLGAGHDRKTVLFMGWFGPRGLATVVFALMILDREDIGGAEEVFGAAVWTVLFSVVLHGLTAAPLSKRFGRAENDLA